MTTLQDLLDQLRALTPEQRRLPATYVTEPSNGMGSCLGVGLLAQGTNLGKGFIRQDFPGFALTKPLPVLRVRMDAPAA